MPSRARGGRAHVELRPASWLGRARWSRAHAEPGSWEPRSWGVVGRFLSSRTRGVGLRLSGGCAQVEPAPLQSRTRLGRAHGVGRLAGVPGPSGGPASPLCPAGVVWPQGGGYGGGCMASHFGCTQPRFAWRASQPPPPSRRTLWPRGSSAGLCRWLPGCPPGGVLGWGSPHITPGSRGRAQGGSPGV